MGAVDFITQTVSWIRFCVFIAATMVSGYCTRRDGVYITRLGRIAVSLMSFRRSPWSHLAAVFCAMEFLYRGGAHGSNLTIRMARVRKSCRKRLCDSLFYAFAWA